eukprot:TRINITY_DN3371_c0_g1_i3.p1 TRINITY_DN3371_c0_g1~~TRINITY_DN3371_c0_g1_i3.p1  ORF type:complete len:208 (+),score=44.76 TRINITY_DN3371_c0_g1_i3:42-626(+)
MWLVSPQSLKEAVSGYWYKTPDCSPTEEMLAAQTQQRIKRSLELRGADYIDEVNCAFCNAPFVEGKVLNCHHSPYCDACLRLFLSGQGKIRCNCGDYTIVPGLDVLPVTDRKILIAEQVKQREEHIEANMGRSIDNMNDESETGFFLLKKSTTKVPVVPASMLRNQTSPSKADQLRKGVLKQEEKRKKEKEGRE